MNSHDEIQHINKEQNALILHMQKNILLNQLQFMIYYEKHHIINKRILLAQIKWIMQTLSFGLI